MNYHCRKVPAGRWPTRLCPAPGQGRARRAARKAIFGCSMTGGRRWRFKVCAHRESKRDPQQDQPGPLLTKGNDVNEAGYQQAGAEHKGKGETVDGVIKPDGQSGQPEGPARRQQREQSNPYRRPGPSGRFILRRIGVRLLEQVNEDAENSQEDQPPIKLGGAPAPAQPESGRWKACAQAPKLAVQISRKIAPASRSSAARGCALRSSSKRVS